MANEPVQKADLFQAKRAVAVLVTCVAQTIHESDPTFEERLTRRMEAAYYQLRDNPVSGDELPTLELLSWVMELLTGFSRVSGRGPSFLEDYRP